MLLGSVDGAGCLINYITFDCQGIGGSEACKQRWIGHGYNVVEIKYEFIHPCAGAGLRGVQHYQARRDAEKNELASASAAV
jgi:hypothetical protein